MSGGEETGHFSDVVAVERAVDAGQRHGQEAVAHVGQVQVEVVLGVDKPALALRHHRLQPPPNVSLPPPPPPSNHHLRPRSLLGTPKRFCSWLPITSAAKARSAAEAPPQAERRQQP